LPAPLEPQAPPLVPLRQIPRVQLAVAELLARRLRVAVVAFRDVASAYEDLALLREPHLLAADRSADRPLRAVERIGDRDDRRRFGEPVPLDHEVAASRPELLHLRVERRSPGDERPRAPSQDAADLAGRRDPPPGTPPL